MIKTKNISLDQDFEAEIEKIKKIRFNFFIERLFYVLGKIWNSGINFIKILLPGVYFVILLGITLLLSFLFLDEINIISNRQVFGVIPWMILFYIIDFGIIKSLQRFSIYKRINNHIGYIKTLLKNQIRYISTGQFVDALSCIYKLSLKEKTNATIEEILVYAKKNRAYLRTLERIRYFSFFLSLKSKDDIEAILYFTTKIHIQIIQNLLTQLSIELTKHTEKIHQAKSEFQAPYMQDLVITPLQIGRLERQMKKFQKLQTKIVNHREIKIL